jgi:hypothetical protein
VDHSRYFVDPRNREIHSQHIEISWCWAKYFIKRKNRKGEDLQEYLNEFCWRRQFKGNHKELENTQLMKALVKVLKKYRNVEDLETLDAPPEGEKQPMKD